MSRPRPFGAVGGARVDENRSAPSLEVLLRRLIFVPASNGQEVQRVPGAGGPEAAQERRHAVQGVLYSRF